MGKFGTFEVLGRGVTVSHGDTVDQLALAPGLYEPASLAELEALRHVEEFVPGRVVCVDEPTAEDIPTAEGVVLGGDHEPTLSDPPGGFGDDDDEPDDHQETTTRAATSPFGAPKES